MRIKKKFPHVALLRKDFIAEKTDVDISYRAGADAVLLIAAILSADEISELYHAAQDKGIHPLVEIHSIAEIDKIRPCAPRVVGINCRDLHTFTTDILRPLAVAAHVDWPCNLVFESGITRASEITMVRAAGFHSILMGETAMRHGDRLRGMIRASENISLTSAPEENDDRVDDGARRVPAPVENADGTLRRPPIPAQRYCAMTRMPFWVRIARAYSPAAKKRIRRPLIKICGLTNMSDAEFAHSCGADLLGMVLCDSPRRATISFAERIVQCGAISVAVVDGEQEISPEALRLYREGHINALQIQGGNAHTYFESMECAYYYTLRIASTEDYAEFARIHSPRILLDCYSATEKGGTGKRIDDSLLCDHPRRAELWLAGGIGVENVAEIITRYTPELIDISSKLEKSPGIKDHRKISAFFKEVDRVCA